MIWRISREKDEISRMTKWRITRFTVAWTENDITSIAIAFPRNWLLLRELTQKQNGGGTTTTERIFLHSCCSKTWVRQSTVYPIGQITGRTCDQNLDGIPEMTTTKTNLRGSCQRRKSCLRSMTYDPETKYIWPCHELPKSGSPSNNSGEFWKIFPYAFNGCVRQRRLNHRVKGKVN